MLLREIIHIIESVAPRSAQEQWDNSGMQVGDTGRDISAALLTTDITIDVVNEAIMHNCQLIISHHPLLFHGLKQLCGQTPQAQIVEMAIKNNIAIYSAHTNIDAVLNGVSGQLAQLLGIQQYRILVPTQSEQIGLGVIGQLPQPMEYTQFLNHVRNTLHTTYIRYTAPATQQVQTIALCGGSGAEFIENAIAQQADVYITADCKYHEMQAADKRIGLIDIDHWVSEQHTRNIFEQLLTPHGIQCHISQTDKTPILVL